MPARTINVVDSDGNVLQRTFSSTECAVRVDGILYSPALTTNVEIENDADQSQSKDQCGNIRRSRVGNQGWNIRVQGFVTGNDSRSNNLSLQLLRDVIAVSDTIWIQTDLITGEFEVSNTVITQEQDVDRMQTDDTSGDEKAFSFQLQLGQSEAE